MKRACSKNAKEDEYFHASSMWILKINLYSHEKILSYTYSLNHLYDYGCL
jgi:hypothetical protein